MSGRRDRLAAEAWRWLRLAEENLRVAELREKVADLPERLACFWAQQAAETALKAVPVAKDADPPRSHDLVELAGRCAVPELAGLAPEELGALGAWAVGARYEPIGLHAPPFDEAVRVARKVVTGAEIAVEGLVGTEQSGGRGG